MNARPSTIHDALIRADAFRRFYAKVGAIPGMSLNAALAAWDVIQHENPTLYAPRIDAREVVLFVAAKMNVRFKDITGPFRWKEYVGPRHVAMWMACEITSRGPSALSRIFERDPSSISYAHSTINAAIGKGDTLGLKALTIMGEFIAAKAKDGVIIEWAPLKAMAEGDA